jgi:Low-density lipoprotein receptor domain class A
MRLSWNIGCLVVLADSVCDGLEDCTDGSDEDSCQ